jgi:hypothetical protein
MERDFFAIIPRFPARARIAPKAITFLWGSNPMIGQAQFFVGWGTLSLINAGLAQSKNRSGLLWWVASLFLGPVATFLIVILDRVESPQG